MAELLKEGRSSQERAFDLLPVLLDLRHVRLGGVGDLESQINVRDRERRFQNDILGKCELTTRKAVDLRDERADFLASIEVSPLVRCHR